MGVAASRSNTKRSSAVTTSNAASDAIVNLLGDTLLSSNGNVATADALAGKSAIGLYFSAHWCPPCLLPPPPPVPAHARLLSHAVGMAV